MLGDGAEKSKNPLKKAMRRRITKAVQFTAPTYVEASDYDYTTEEESDGQTNIDEGGSETHDEEARDDPVSEQEPTMTDSHTTANRARESTMETSRDSEDAQKEDNEQRSLVDDPRSNEDIEESTRKSCGIETSKVLSNNFP